MAYIYYNPNPNNTHVGDCAVRAVAKILGKDWEDAYIGLCAEGWKYKDMPTSAYVIGMYLREHDFRQKMIPNICPDCTTVKKFAQEHGDGKYITITEEHMTAVMDGDYYDTWDSGDEIVLYYYEEGI